MLFLIYQEKDFVPNEFNFKNSDGVEQYSEQWRNIYVIQFEQIWKERDE